MCFFFWRCYFNIVLKRACLKCFHCCSEIGKSNFSVCPWNFFFFLAGRVIWFVKHWTGVSFPTFPSWAMYLTDMTAHDVRAGLRSSLSETSRSFPFVGVEGVYTRVGDPLFPHCRLLTRGGEGGGDWHDHQFIYWLVGNLPRVQNCLLVSYWVQKKCTRVGFEGVQNCIFFFSLVKCLIFFLWIWILISPFRPLTDSIDKTW